MCSVQEDDVVIPSKKNSRSDKCMKCGDKAVTVVRAADSLCGPCFIIYTTHKFRAAFGKSKIVRDEETVAVAYSGGASSAAMLHLIKEGKSSRAQKKLRFLPTLIYIDESCTIEQSEGERSRLNDDVIHQLQALGYPYHVHSLEEVMQSHGDESPSSEVSAALSRLSLSTKLSDLLTNAKTLTARETLLRVLRERLLVSIVQDLHLSKLLIGDTSTRLSIRLISSLTQGRGAHVASDVSFKDDRHGDVYILRPMREFSSKEVAAYNSLNNISSCFIPSISTKESGSLERLAEKFILGLQADFPNTVSTIFRTGEKLVDNSARHAVCSFCQGNLDTEFAGNSALAALQYSRSLAPPGSEHNMTNRPDTLDLNQQLCYGCRHLAADMEPVCLLDRNSITKCLLIANQGQQLHILVENQGRINYGGQINDNRKGLTSNVTLAGQILKDWKILSLDFSLIFNKTAMLSHQPISQSSAPPAVYMGYFDIPHNLKEPCDTFLKTDGWFKGQAFVNGFNLGRYWPVRGPQKTLYVPASVLKPQHNILVLVELERTPCQLPSCVNQVEFVDMPILG